MRVPNGLVVLGILAGAMLSLMGERSGGVFQFLVSLIWPAIILYPVYLIGGLGAGDVKLIAAIATIIGTGLTLSVIIYSLIIGAVIGVSRWILEGQVLYRIKNIKNGIVDVLFYKQNSAYYKETEQKEKLHFTICILWALVVCILKEGVK